MMEKAEAETRLDELLDGVAEVAREGRCRHCEAIPSESLTQDQDKLFFLPTAEAGPEQLKVLGVQHAQGCPLRGVDAEIQRLVDQLGQHLEPVLVKAPPRGVFISGHRTGRRAVRVEGQGDSTTYALESGVCDICAGEGASWRYPCRDFTTPQGQTSEGPWDVCDRCHELIEAGDVAEMTRLGTAPLLKAAAKLNKTQRAKFYEVVGSFQRQFMASRTGPGQRLEA